jgi:acetyl esterase/lipase
VAEAEAILAAIPVEAATRAEVVIPAAAVEISDANDGDAWCWTCASTAAEPIYKAFMRFSLAAASLLALASLHAADTPLEDPPALTPGEAEVRKHLSAEEFEITTIRLWPGQPPDEVHAMRDELVIEGRRGSRIEMVSQPSITVARPKSLKEAAPAILVCPGGGYGSVGISEGGVDIINWLKPLGVIGVFVKYRVPKRNQDYEMYHHALQDIQRATSLLRSRAAELRIDPKRIGAIGFSAGGNLVAMLSIHHRPEDRLYQAIDQADEVSCRPDFVALVAPAYLTNPIVSDKLIPGLDPEKIARNITLPTFITSAITDKFTVGASHYLLLLREKHVPVEFHVYERGGHAEGIHDGPDNQWPRMFKDWLRRQGVIPQPAGAE